MGIDKNLFFTIKAEAKASVFAYVYNKTGGQNRVYDVSIEVFKVSMSVSVGSLNGYEMYAALIDGSFGVFDIRIAVGFSSQFGIKDGTL